MKGFVRGLLLGVLFWLSIIAIANFLCSCSPIPQSHPDNKDKKELAELLKTL